MSITISQMKNHIDALVKEHNLIVELPSPEIGAFALPKEKKIGINAIDSASNYYEALHEIGHMMMDPELLDERAIWGKTAMYAVLLNLKDTFYVAKIKEFQAMLKGEKQAWDWAKKEALEITPEMAQFAEYGFGTYKSEFKRLLNEASFSITLNMFEALLAKNKNEVTRLLEESKRIREIEELEIGASAV